MKQVEVALKYAEAGIPVFPCYKTKRPRIKSWDVAASTDPAVIRKWWEYAPDSLVAAPNNGFMVLDIDWHKTCASGRLLTETTLDALFQGFDDVVEHTMSATTMTGGAHMYFAPIPGVTRRIGVLPNIDLLAANGYVILPDNRNVVADTDTPWEKINNLPDFPYDRFCELVEELKETTALAADFKRSFKESSENTRGRPTKKKKVVPAKTKKQMKDASDVPTILEMNRDVTKRDSIDYKNGTIRLTQVPDMYHINENYESDETILDQYVDGRLYIGAGELTSARINALFHYPPIQHKMARFLGLDVPEMGERTVQRSVLPGHVDNKPSLGVRWNKGGTHILVRDFSNFFSDVYEQTDYNLVRLYSTMCYKALTPRLSPAEFVIWFLRLMHDSGILNVDGLKKRYAIPSAHNSPDFARYKMEKNFILLDALKQTYYGYNGTTTFSDRFSSAWCDLTPSIANRVKKDMHHDGMLHFEGVYDCSGGKRDDGFYETSLFSVLDKEKIVELNKQKALEKETAKAERAKAKAKKSKAKKCERVNTETGEIINEETTMNSNKSDDIVTLRAFGVSEDTYKKIKHCCEDFNIKPVAFRNNMFIECGVVGGIEGAPFESNETSFEFDNLYLEIAPEIGGGNGYVLLLVGESEDYYSFYFDELSKIAETKDDVTFYSDEPLMALVIATDIKEDFDVSKMQVAINKYLGGEFVVDNPYQRVCKFDDLMKYLYNGKDPVS